MRFILDLYYTPDGGVHGRLTPPGSVTAQPFDGWLDLLRLLEPPAPRRRVTASRGGPLIRAGHGTPPAPRGYGTRPARRAFSSGSPDGSR
nr:hypothetical protein GCM10020093_012940 [Planobispora longispora]